MLAAFVALALALNISIPLGEAPDEVSHFAYVQYLVQQHRLPEREGPAAGQAHQPPLYYLTGALATFWIPDQKFDILANPDWELDNPDVPNLLLHTRQESFPYHGGALAWHILRLLSTFLGAVTVWATWRIAREVFPENDELALVAAAFVAFLPQFTFLSSVVNNDNLVIALAALSLLTYLRYRGDHKPIYAVMLGLLLGLAILAKISAFTLWVAIGLAYLVGEREARSLRLKRLFLIFAVALAVLIPWLAYNTLVYGDPLSLSRLLGSTPRIEPMTASDWLTYGIRIYQSFWGKFGGVTNLTMPGLVYVILTGLAAAGLVGLGLHVMDWRAGHLPLVSRQALVTFGIYGAVLIGAHVWLMLSVLGMDQARQLFAGLPPLAIMLAAGLLRLARQYRHHLTLAIPIGMALIGLLNWQILTLTYASPSQAATLGSTTGAADFGGMIRVANYQISQTRLTPGESLTIQLDWQALKDPARTYWILLQLADAAGGQVNKDGVPAGGRVTTDLWQTGQTFTSRHSLIVPPDLAPGTYTLRMGLHPLDSWDWLTVRGQEMLVLGQVTVQ